MATKSQEVFKNAKEAGLVEKRNFVKFKGTGEHILKFISDMAIEGTNFRTHKPEKKMKYTFEEGGDVKFYETAIFTLVKDNNGVVEQNEDGSDKKKLSSFVESMNNFEYGDILKMVYTPIPGTPRGYTKIEKMNLGEEEEGEIEKQSGSSDPGPVKEEEIPIIEDDPFGEKEEEIDPKNIPY